MEKYIAYRKEELFFYSPYNFIRQIPKDSHLKEWVIPKITQYIESGQYYQTIINGNAYYFLYEKLSWDTDYFGLPCYKLFTVLYDSAVFDDLVESIRLFTAYLDKSNTQFYLFTEIPSEDTYLLQGLTKASYRLVENRLHYLKNNLQNFDNQRFKTRYATIEDALLLSKIAKKSRNNYDRTHADVLFDDTQADAYLATYAAACLKGFADKTLLPDEVNESNEAFLSIKNTYLEINGIQKINFARVLLTAVLPTCKGWHYKLVSETVHYAKEVGFDYVVMTTQATNGAVIHNCEKLEFKLQGLGHILVMSNY